MIRKRGKQWYIMLVLMVVLSSYRRVLDFKSNVYISFKVIRILYAFGLLPFVFLQ